MEITEEMDQKHQEDLARLRAFRLFDDDFMTACLQRNPACTELVLRILLEQPDLEVSDVRTQVFVENLSNRSVWLDVLATDAAGKNTILKFSEKIGEQAESGQDITAV